jgi:hypothetical protein
LREKERMRQRQKEIEREREMHGKGTSDIINFYDCTITVKRNSIQLNGMKNFSQFFSSLTHSLFILFFQIMDRDMRE